MPDQPGCGWLLPGLAHCCVANWSIP